ncbi:hypothetical protein HU200_023345 [Digitaria exilis]|uniref:Uncharacterized protein n=1 Tax=Digitaria exilis TaxID=1010633 RepID=A0A835C5W0_9POAL|nr:hypothetical protein HU200_023345 [Digitaria exilis]
MTLCSRKEPKLIAPAVIMLASLLLLLQFQSTSCSSSSCCFDQRGGGAAVRLLHGRRLLRGHAKGAMEPAVAKKGGEALGEEEEKREVITGPNPLHNRR